MWSRRKAGNCLYEYTVRSDAHTTPPECHERRASSRRYHLIIMSSPASPPPPPTLLDQTTGHCACKRTTFTVRLNNISSDLRLSAYCHCSQCQRLNGAPFIWTTHWAEDAVHWSSTTAPPNDDADSDPAVIRPLTRGGARLIPHEGPIPFIPPYMPDPSFAPSMAVYEAMPMRKWKLRCDHCGTPLGSWNQAKKQ